MREIDRNLLTKAQSELLDNVQEMNRQWLDRIHYEACCGAKGST